MDETLTFVQEIELDTITDMCLDVHWPELTTLYVHLGYSRYQARRQLPEFSGITASVEANPHGMGSGPKEMGYRGLRRKRQGQRTDTPTEIVRPWPSAPVLEDTLFLSWERAGALPEARITVLQPVSEDT